MDSKESFIFTSHKNCCVPQCNSKQRKGLSLHRFPTSEKLKKEWVILLKIGKKVSKTMAVCGKHFVETDFIPRAGIPKKKRLKKTAKPSQFLPVRPLDAKFNSILAAARQSRRDKRAAKQEEVSEGQVCTNTEVFSLQICKSKQQKMSEINIDVLADETIYTMPSLVAKRKRCGTRYCSAINCSNSRAKNRDMSFFCFPRDPDRCRLWIQNCRRQDLPSKDVHSLHKSFQLCPAHFEDTQFIDPILKNRLQNNAVPTIFHFDPLDSSVPEMTLEISASKTSDCLNDPRSTSEESSIGDPASMEMSANDFLDVRIKIEDEVSVTEDAPETCNVQFHSDVTVKSEFTPQPLQFLSSFEEPPRQTSVVNIKVEPLPRVQHMTDDGYIVPDNLEDVLPATVKDSTSRTEGSLATADNVSTTHDISINETIQDTNEIQPVLLTMAKPTDPDIISEEGASKTNCEEGEHRNRRKQVLVPKEDLKVDEYQQRNRRKQVLLPKEDPEDESAKIALTLADGSASEINKPQPSYECKECGSKFVLERTFKKHKRSHKVQKQMKCIVCHMHFKTLDDFNDHVLSHTDQPPFPCVICKKPFLNARSLVRHVITHPGMRPYKCSKCNLRFSSEALSKTHERDFHGVESNKTSDSSEIREEKSHVQIHNRPFKCCYCSSSFISFKTLSLHTRNSHSNSREHKCAECGETFPMSYLLIRHIYCGKGKCNVCFKNFEKGCALVKHMKSHVQNVSSYACKVCGTGFSNRNAAHKHARTEHPAELQFVKNSKYLIDYITTTESV